MTGHWQELDHTADLAISVYGSDLAALFITSAQGLFDLAFESGPQEIAQHFSIKLTAPDVETLLIDWLNELLYLSEKHNACFVKFEFLAISPTALNSKANATKIKLTKQYIKAATFHNISVVQSCDGFHTDIVFDI